MELTTVRGVEVVGGIDATPNTFVAFLGEIRAQPWGWLFACLHASWFLLAIANMSPPSRELGSLLDSGVRSFGPSKH